jgi:hypothetical protein
MAATDLFRPETDIVVVITPAYDRHGRRRHEKFEARRRHCDAIICISAQPLLDVSRIFLSAGADPATRISLVHSNRPEQVALIASIGAAAEYDVMGTRYIKRKPSLSFMSGVRMRVGQRAVSTHPTAEMVNGQASHNEAAQNKIKSDE